MGAGKSTVGARVAEATARPFVDLDRVIERRHGPIPELFERGEGEFRQLEEAILAEVLAGPDSVVALGGGAVLSPLSRERLRTRAFTVFLDVSAESAWERVRGSGRPLAQREDDFRTLYESRQVLYAEAADAVAETTEDVLHVSLGIGFGRLVRPAGAVEIVADEHVLELHAAPLEAPVHPLPPGEGAKSPAVVERLWKDLRLDRDGTIVAFGGGSTTDVAGFVAATYLRGIRWVAVPTTLTG
ncbi:MAG: shikimate kinase, partial [Gaiellaceae bacterium]